jgi:gamma-glutamyl hydrolase
MPMANSTMALGPVIALLTQPLTAPSQRPGVHPHAHYIPASYVKWIEMAGGRVVPLSYYANDSQVDELIGQVNGVLLPGGGGDVPPAARRVYAHALRAAAAGDPFPVWGTCDGFEWLMQIASDDDGILVQGFDSENISLALKWEDGARKSRVMADALDTPIQGSSPRLSIFDALGSLPLTLNNHVQGVTPSDFRSSEKLSAVFEVLATNTDRKGRKFVSMVEGRAGLPIWATQFHPEKNIFEQGVSLPSGSPYEAIAHSRSAVAVSQYMANFFVDQARRSTRSFHSAEDEWSRLFYQLNASLLLAPAFVQTYTFDGSH